MRHPKQLKSPSPVSNRTRALNEQSVDPAIKKRVPVTIEYDGSGKCFVVIDSESEGEGTQCCALPERSSKVDRLLKFMTTFQDDEEEEEDTEDEDYLPSPSEGVTVRGKGFRRRWKGREQVKNKAFSVARGEQFKRREVNDTALPGKLKFDPVSTILLSKRREVTSVERRRATKAGGAYMQVITGPKFMVAMGKRNIYQGFDLDLPVKFVNDSKLPDHKPVALTLIDLFGESWKASCLGKSTDSRTLCREQWALFAVEHFLEDGDVCVFELTDSATFRVLVRIFRVVELPKLLPKDGRGDYCNHYIVVRKR